MSPAPKLTLDLLEKTFRDLEEDNFFIEARAKAYLFLHYVRKMGFQIDEDYWLQLGRNWNLNIINGEKMILYPIYKRNGSWETDMTDGGVVICSKDE